MKKSIKRKILFGTIAFAIFSTSALIASSCSLNKKPKLQTDKQNTTAKDNENNLYIKVKTKYDLEKIKKIAFQTVIEKEFNLKTYPINAKQNGEYVEFYLKLPKVSKESTGIIVNPTGFFEPLPFVLLKNHIETNNILEIEGN